jgi:hypothetical protein
MNIYDYSYKFGTNFNNSYSPQEDTNKEDYYSNGTLFLTSEQITGINSTRLSFNGQTLLEQIGQLYTIGGQQIYLNSGDYYVKSGESFKSIGFSSSFDSSIAGNFPFIYHIKDDFRESPVGTGNNYILKTTNFVSQLNTKFPDRAGTFSGMNSFDYFFNGQKLYSGQNEDSGSYYFNESNEFIYLDGSSDINLFKDGELFAITKNSRLGNVTGNSPDFYGTKFVENTVFAYVNGISLHKKNWLELSTGVKLIEFGLQASIFEPVINQTELEL